MKSFEENAVRQYHLYVVKTLIESGIVTNPLQIISLQNLVNRYIADQAAQKNCKTESMKKRLNRRFRFICFWLFCCQCIRSEPDYFFIGPLIDF